MGQIIAWQCDVTKEVFLDKKEYNSHVRKLAKKVQAAKKKDDAINTFYTWLAKERDAITDVSEIVPWLISNQQYIMDCANIIGGLTAFNDKFRKDDKFVNIQLDIGNFGMQTNGWVSPRGYPRNWCGMRKDLPTGYSGWHGRICGRFERVSHKSDYPYSALYNAVGIYTGTGGGGNENHDYEATLFACEWTGLAIAESAKKLSNNC